MRLKTTTLLICSLLLTACLTKKKSDSNPHIISNFNNGWTFINKNIPIDEVKNSSFKWDSITIPHDWTAKTPYAQTYKVTDSTPVLGGIGWYKKEFKLGDTSKNKQISIEFDGVYNNSEVWINGHYLGFWPYGYTAFSYNLTPYLKFNGTLNEILVKVNRENFLDCRWYAGSGIYRDVKLVAKEKIHFPKWGIKIETPKITTSKATIKIDFQTINLNKTAQNLKVVHSIIDGKNEILSEYSEYKQVDSIAKHSINLLLDSPKLWSPDTPNLYQLVSKIYVDNQLVDNVSNTFGVRSLRFDPKKGFFLNEKSTPFKGVCIHHDGGALGSAVPKNLWLKRLSKLKEAGVNAIRTAHNPASKEFLELCDSLGFLVQEEIFDELNYPKDKRRNYNGNKANAKYEAGYTNYFQKHWKKDLGSMVKRDYNHPSIIMWSIGNEIEWTYPNYSSSSGYFHEGASYYFDPPPLSTKEMKLRFKKAPKKEKILAETVKKLSSFTKEIDTTRPVTANLVLPTVSYFSGYADALDIIGLSYRGIVYDWALKNYPEKMIYGSENWANYIEWKYVEDNPHVPGIFLWTGIYYMGETKTPGNRGSVSGIINYSGVPTPRWYQFKSVWTEQPTLYATTYPLKDSYYKVENNKVVYKEKDKWKYKKWTWQPYNTHWNYKEGTPVIIETFTNCPEVKLFINGKEKGVQRLNENEDKVLKFTVPFEKGEVKLVGSCSKTPIEYQLKTASEPVSVKLTATNSKVNELIIVEAQLIDEKGNPVSHKEEKITFQFNNDLIFMGIENDSNSLKTTSSIPEINTFRGRAVLYLMATKTGAKNIISELSDKNRSTLKITVK